MDSARRKELRNAYKEKPVVGGICCIRCSGNKRSFVQMTTNIEGLKNRFEFAMATKTCPDPTMHAEWLKYGSDSFSFSILEQITKSDEQTNADFSRDIEALYELWIESHREPAGSGTDEQQMPD